MKKRVKEATAETMVGLTDIGLNNEDAPSKLKKKEGKNQKDLTDEFFEKEIYKLLQERAKDSRVKESNEIVAVKKNVKKKKNKIYYEAVVKSVIRIDDETLNAFIKEKKKKKSKISVKNEENSNVIEMAGENQIDVNTDEYIRKKKKKKRDDSCETPQNDVIAKTVVKNNANDDVIPEKKKKKKHKHPENTTEPNSQEDCKEEIDINQTKNNKKALEQEQENLQMRSFSNDEGVPQNDSLMDGSYECMDVYSPQYNNNNNKNHTYYDENYQQNCYQPYVKPTNHIVRTFGDNSRGYGGYRQNSFKSYKRHYNNDYNEETYQENSSEMPQDESTANVTYEQHINHTTYGNNNCSYNGYRQNFNQHNHQRETYQQNSFEMPQDDLIMNVTYEPHIQPTNHTTPTYGYNDRKFNGSQQRSFKAYVRQYNKHHQNAPECDSLEQTFVGTPPIDAPSETTDEGTILRLNEAQFGPPPRWLRKKDQSETSAKKSYKHLIKGDIVIQFKNTNLHQIKGYAVKKK